MTSIRNIPNGDLWLILTLIFSGCSNIDTKRGIEKPKPLFTLLMPDSTGVRFENTLTEGPNTNILVYEYFYNGGGVAAGDLNNDGLIDLYFTSNMAANALYINMGDMLFEDVSEYSKTLGRPGPWKTGTTMVDINGDEKLDIYLCYSGALPDEKRKNQLFINQGNDKNGFPVFIDQAEKYGLASAAFSNQAYFLDYDRDGDLDVLLLNHNPKSLPILNEIQTAELLLEDAPHRGLRIYRQSNGHFTDVTQLANINGSPLSYGLGLGISDFNNDGWPDFYVSNDYAVNDYLYINNQDGTFTNKLTESMGHTSQFSMGNDVADVNNDGLQDIVSLDMLPEDNVRQKLLLSPDNYDKFDHNVRSGFYYQYMRNMLQLNNGDGSFSEVGQLSGISNTDWSWAALLADYNNDGWKDLFVTNGYYRDYTNLDFIKYMDSYVQSKGRLVRQEVLGIIEKMPASDVTSYMFSNEMGKSFSNQTKNWGLQHPASSNGGVYADLDNDGDLDLIVNNINDPAFIYRNESRELIANNYLQLKLVGKEPNTQGIGTKVKLWSNGKTQSLEQYLSRGYLSAISPRLHFGIGEQTVVDSLWISWPNGDQQSLDNIAANQIVNIDQREASDVLAKQIDEKSLFNPIKSPISHLDMKPQINDFKRQPLLISALSFSGPCMVKGDLNNDGLDDVFIGGSKGQKSELYFQSPDGKLMPVIVPAFEQDKDRTDTDAVIFDANADGFNDIYVASGGYHTYSPNDPLLQDRLYLNDGINSFSSQAAALPNMLVSTGSVAISDVNGDDFVDIYVGGRVVPGRYPESPLSYVLINDGNGHFLDMTSSMGGELVQYGMITDAEWVDLNLDEVPELVVVGEWLPPSVFKIEKGTLVNRTNHYFDQSYSGWWNRIQVADFNRDGKPDLLLGNMGMNTQFKVSNSEPVEMYYKDYDENGTVDPLFTFYIQGTSYPYLTRDELLSQLTVLRSRFTTYDSYANVTLSEIFSNNELKDFGHLTANHMETSLFLSNTNGKFEKRKLPLEVQYAPIYTISILDYDGDQNIDVLLCGNNSNAKLRLGKYDANYGVLLKGDGEGNFKYIKQAKSGFALKGDVRSALQINNLWLFGINSEPIVAYDLAR